MSRRIVLPASMVGVTLTVSREALKRIRREALREAAAMAADPPGLWGEQIGSLWTSN